MHTICCQALHAAQRAAAQFTKHVTWESSHALSGGRTARALTLVVAKLCTKGTSHRLGPLVLAVILCVAPLSTAVTRWTQLLYVEVEVPAQVFVTESAQGLTVY